MGFSSQEYQSGLPCTRLEDLPDSEIEPVSPEFPALQADSLQLNHGGEAHGITSKCSRIKALFVGLGVDVEREQSDF